MFCEQLNMPILSSVVVITVCWLCRFGMLLASCCLSCLLLSTAVVVGLLPITSCLSNACDPKKLKSMA